MTSHSPQGNLLSLMISDKTMREALKSIGTVTKRGKKSKQSDSADALNRTAGIHQTPQNAVSPDESNPDSTLDEIKGTAVANESSSPPAKSAETPAPNTETVEASKSSVSESTPSIATLELIRSASPVNDSRLTPICESSDQNPLHEENADGTIIDTQHKSQSKKKRRKTRSLSPVPNPKKRCSERFSIVRRQIESLLGISTDESSSKTDIEVHKLMLESLEDIISGSTDTFFFAIAGKKLFEPEGSLPSKTVKRLARNAGSVRAPFIAYETPFEVGESTTCHYWRTITLNGKTFEDFALSLKFFKEHIDQGVREYAHSNYDLYLGSHNHFLSNRLYHHLNHLSTVYQNQNRQRIPKSDVRILMQ
jgi:hypothetical protein